MVRLKRLSAALAGAFGYDLVRRWPDMPGQLGLAAMPFATVLDIGANDGHWARQWRGIFPDARFYCFEPLPACQPALQALAGGDHGVTVFPVALGAETGAVEMQAHEDHAPSSSLLPATGQMDALYPQTARRSQVTVPVRRLDDVLAEVTLPAGPMLVKMDVQGFEDRVIDGGPATFARADAVIAEVSNLDLYEGQASFADIHDRLRAAGLQYHGNLDQVFDRKTGRLRFYDAVFLRNRADGSV